MCRESTVLVIRNGPFSTGWFSIIAEQETMDYLEFIARVVSHIPDKGQVTVRYYGLCANARRAEGKPGLRP
jgi:hypothetical protein